MKNNFYIFFLLMAAGFFALSNSGGAGTVQGQDRTGSPVGAGSCQTCHNGGAFNASASISVLSGDEAVTEYIPGEQYTVRVSSTFQGEPSLFGFQAVALDGNNDSAGAWVDGDGYKIVGVGGRSYTEQSPVSGGPTFDITWTAPTSGVGTVSFYAATCVADGNGGSGGDNGSIASAVSLAQAEGSNIFNNTTGKMELTIMPNPVSEVLSYKVIGRDNGIYEMRLTDAFGKTVYTEKVNLNTGENILNASVSELPEGTYILHLSGKNFFAAERMVKL